MELTRRNFVATAAGAAVGAVALGSLNVANAVAETTDGGLIFEGMARGMRGHITVHVTLDGEGIAAVDVVKNTETPEQVSAAAIAAIPQAIVDGQTVNVDAVAGATISSMAIINAVTSALEAAGVADQFNGDAPVPELVAPSDESCDVLVLGGGLAGCQAAVAARYADYGRELNELRVIIVEEQGFLGGSSQLAGGTFSATQPLNDVSNVDRLFEDEFSSFDDPDYPVNKEFVRNLVTISGINAYQNLQMGFPFVCTGALDAPENFDTLIGWYDEPRPNPTVFGEGVWSFAGWRIMQFMKERVEVAGVEVRLNTEAKELVVEDGAVTGVVVEGLAGQYTITAQKVIIATGGFCANPEMVAQYAPTYVNAIPYVNAGCKGDGFTMAQAVDAVIDGYDSCGGPLGVDVYFGGFNDMGYDFGLGWAFPAGFNCVVVNSEGVRFMADSAALPSDEGPTPRTVLQQPGGIAWSIFDSANPSAATADASAMQESIFKADTIAELAELIGVPADALQATIDGYNEMQSSGTDDAEFGVAAADMSPVTQAPFYAVACRATMCYSGSGLRVAEHGEVVNSAGAVVPNLYAAGEVAFAGNSLTCLGGAMAQGRLVGDAARDAIVGA